tara:strand:+ start:486 stop:1706 length:1221 start_codon:yes stop_codon:yes gene_type:complete
MRILIGVGRWEAIGGSERYALDVTRSLARAGHDITVLCGGGEAPLPRGVRRIELCGFGDLWAHESRAELAGILAGLVPDVVLQLSPTAPWVSAELVRAAPLVRFVQDHTLFCPGLNRLHRDGGRCEEPPGVACHKRLFLRAGCRDLRPGRGALDRIKERTQELDVHRDAARLLVASGWMRDQLVTAGIPADKVTILPYPTVAATTELQSAPLSLELEAFLAAGPAPVIVSARLVPEKGVDVALDALVKLRHARAVIAGDGPLLNELRERAAVLGLNERVHFTGWIDHGQIEALLPRCSVLSMPSTWDEPFGLVGIEAMAHGVPVVASDVGGVPEWLAEGEGGVRVVPGDAADLARVLRVWLADPRLRERIGRAGSARVERSFRPAQHVAALETILTNASRSSVRVS